MGINDSKINAYMFMLKLSLTYLDEAINDYEVFEQENPDSDIVEHGKKYHLYYYAIDYHMFTFTQLIYTIQERLIVEYPSHTKDINKFFKKDKNIVAATQILANKLKHHKDRTDFQSYTMINIELNKEFNNSKVKSVEHDRIIEISNNQIDKKPLNTLFKKVFQELKDYLDSKGWEY